MAKVILDKSHYQVLGPLICQLRFVPPGTLIEQTYRAENLIALIHPAKRYPYDFVCFKITDYKPKEMTGQAPIDGKALIADLARFVSQVSSQVVVPIDQLRSPALAVEDLAEQAGVSIKTVQRWRDLGLPQRLVTGPQRRSVRVVLSRTWRRFVERNERRVGRAAAFSRLTVRRRHWIVRQARRLHDGQGLSRHQIEQQLACHLERAPETIRYVLKDHDSRCAVEQRIFPSRRRITGRDKEEIWHRHRDGAAVGELARHYGRSESSVYRLIQEARVCHWLGKTIAYVYSPEFDLPNAEEAILEAVNFVAERRKEKGKYLSVLTTLQERSLFRAYNYLKWQEEQRLVPYRGQTSIAAHVLDSLDALEERAQSIRATLILSNQALIVSIAKRHVTAEVRLNELVSEGILPLTKAIEKFDYSRGNKFSTYASWAIMKHYARIVPQQGEHRQHYYALPAEELELLLPGVMDVDQSEAFRRSKAVQRALAELNERERAILISRFGLDRKGDPLSLAQLGKQFGVTKERVRQIESGAMKKMHGILKAELAEATE